MAHDLDRHALAALACEMAKNLHGRAATLHKMNVTEAQMTEIEKDEYYQRTFDDYVADWNRPTSAKERMEHVGAAYALEIMPPIAGKAMRDDDTPLTQRVEALKVISMIGGAGRAREDRGSSDSRERFVIQINMGAISEVYDKPLAADAPKTIEHEK